MNVSELVKIVLKCNEKYRIKIKKNNIKTNQIDPTDRNTDGQRDIKTVKQTYMYIHV